MNKKKQKPTTSIRVRLCPEQKAKLTELADERDVPLESIMAGVIAGMTGVPDSLTRQSRRGTGVPGAPRRPRRPKKT